MDRQTGAYLFSPGVATGKPMVIFQFTHRTDTNTSCPFLGAPASSPLLESAELGPGGRIVYTGFSEYSITLVSTTLFPDTRYNLGMLAFTN
jgi:hypothetical protein